MFLSTYHIERKQCVQLDEPMEVAKYDRDRQVLEIARVTSKQSHKLDDLGEGKHEDELCPESMAPPSQLPIGRCPPKRGKEEWVDKESERRERGKVKCVSAPRLLTVDLLAGDCVWHGAHYSRPDVALCDNACPIAAPVAACPAGALVQELEAVLQGRFDLTLGLVLNPSVPLVAD